MPSVFDEVDAPKRSVFDDEISPKPKRSVFDEEAQPTIGENLLEQPFISQTPDPIDPLGRLGIENPSASEFLPDVLKAPANLISGGVGRLLDAPTDISNYVRNQEPGMEGYVEPTFRGERSHESPIIRPDMVPTGTEIKSKTGLPEAIATPASGILKAGAGLGEFFTTPAALPELVTAATPAGLLQKAKWVADMAEGAGHTLGNLSADVEEAVKSGSATPEQKQRIAENTANGLLLLYGAGKLSSHELSNLTGIRAPIGRFLESDKARMAKDLAEQLAKEPDASVAPEPTPQRQLGIRIPEGEFSQPGILPLADAALREAQSPIAQPGQPAIDVLRNEINPPRIDLQEPTRLAERVEGGGEAPYGKVSYQRTLEGGPNAIQSKSPSVLRSVFDEPSEGQAQVPGEVAGGKADVGGGKESATQEGKVSQAASDFINAVKNPEVKVTNAETSTGGMALESVSDLDALLEAKREIKTEMEAIRARAKEKQAAGDMEGAMSEMNKMSVVGMKNQGLREIIETATDTGSWSEANKINQEKPLGQRPLDWKKNPEVEAWLRKNGPEIGIELPENPSSSKPSEAVAPEPLLEAPSPSVIESAINGIEALQKQLRSGSKSGQTMMGVPHAILDTALEAARLSLKAGKSVAEAIEAALLHIRKNVKAFDENKVREMFSRELSGANPVNQSGTGEAAKQKAVGAKAPTLDDIYKIFEPEKKTGPSLKQKGINLIEGFRTGISSKFRPINKLAEGIAKAYGQTSSKDIAGIMEQLKGSQGKAEADIYRFDRDVSNLVKGDEKDFNAYVFLRRSIDRLNQDSADIAKAQGGGNVPQLNRRAVANYTLNDLQPKLQALEQKIGPEKLKQFQQAADSYQAHLDQALRLQVESGRMSQEVYDNIKKGNQFYAPFKVMKYIEESMKPQGAGPRIDTTADYTKAMKGIEDPDFKLGDLLAAARQSISMSRILADKNNAMRSVAELAATDTRGDFIKKLKPEEEPPKGMEAVNVIENGKKNRYAVDEDVAAAVQIYGGNAGGILVRALSKMSIPFRAGATALNLPFQVSNLLADVPRQALVSKYGIRGVNDLWRYPADLVHSLYSSISGDVFGKDNKLFLDFLDSGVAGTTVQEHLTPEALKFKEPTNISKSKKLASSVINLVPEFTKAIEQTSKILGVKRAMRFEGVQSGKELATQIPEAVTELRRFSGSPDFGRQGKAIEEARLNLLYMFLNARIQGAVADIGRLGGRDGAATAGKTWRNLAIAVGIPTAYLYYLNNSDEYKEDFAKRPLQEKQNYWLIPKDSFITNDDGEKIRDYWRIPKRESSKWIANFTESALNFAGKRDPQSAKDFGASMVQELMPVNIQGENAQERLESVASGLNPMIKAPLELASGRDLYRHRTIVPDSMKNASPEQQYTPRTAEAFKKLAVAMPDVAPEFLRNPLILENLTKNLTAGLITQFLPRKPVEGRSGVENNPLLARFQGLPYTDNAAFKEEMQNLEREAADEQLARHRAATKILDENPKADLSTMAAKANGDVKLINHLADLYVARQNGITAQERQLLSLPARQRAMYVADQIQGLNPGDRENKIMELARKRILTEAVLQELPEFIKQ